MHRLQYHRETCRDIRRGKEQSGARHVQRLCASCALSDGAFPFLLAPFWVFWGFFLLFLVVLFKWWFSAPAMCFGAA